MRPTGFSGIVPAMRRGLVGVAFGIVGFGCSAASAPTTERPSAEAAAASVETPTAATAGTVAANPTAPVAPPASSGVAAAAGSSAKEPPPPPASIDYPFVGLKLIGPDCAEPSVVVTTAPSKVGWDYDWIWTRQALFANEQFSIVSWPNTPAKAGEIRMDVYEIASGFALVGVCADSKTCNELAAMYRHTVPSCKPQLNCGEVPISGEPRRANIIPKDGHWLPASQDDLTAQCARIGVCLKMANRVAGNPGVVCQSRPNDFKVACGAKPSCDAVLSCLDAR